MSEAAETLPPEALRPTAAPSPLDRPLALDRVGWLALAWAAILATAIALRLSKLDLWALTPAEARPALAAWLLYTGQPAPADTPLPNVGPLPLLLESFAFFLFGATDATFRLASALAGIGLVALPLLLWPWAGRWALLGMGLLAALSPTLLYASRIANGEILAALLALTAAVTLFWLGAGDAGPRQVRRRAVLLGVLLGLLLGVGPSALQVLIALAIGVAFAGSSDQEGPIRLALRRLAEPRAWLAALPAFAATVVVLFSRLFSAPAALSGVPETAAGWWSLLTVEAGQSPALALLALLLYEPLAVVLAIAGTTTDWRFGGEHRPRPALPALLGGWFLAALALWSLAAGSTPEQIVQAALPLALLGGLGLGGLVAAVDWRGVWFGRGGLLALALLGLLVAGAAVLSLLGRAGGPNGWTVGALPATLVTTLVAVPLAYAVWRLVDGERQEGRASEPGRIALLALALLLGAVGLRSAILLSFDRAGEGTEPLAQRVTTGAVRPAVERLQRLARDVGVGQGSVRDPTGSYGLAVAIDEAVAWPWRWYLRRFPEATVVPAGTALERGAEVILAPDPIAAEAAGYAVDALPVLTGVPEVYTAPDLLDLLRRLVLPGDWVADWRFLLFREGVTVPPAQPVALGLGPELAVRVAPRAGPFSLSQRPGPGDADGQFDRPIGIAAAADGTIYVVDSGNGRVQRFDAFGTFLGAWGGTPGGLAFARTDNGLGPTGIAVGDELIWVADTWNHRVVAVDPTGRQVLQLGGDPGLLDAAAPAADIGDDPALVATQPGRFFGPRAIALAGDEVFVADTGNERVQVFGRDGTFRRAFGGYGSEPGRLIEPVGLAIGPDGNLYVADSGNARIAVVTPAGEPVRQIPVAAWPPPDPTGARPAFQPYLAFDAVGRLYATASENGTVEVFAPDGTPLGPLFVAGGERFERPIGIAVAPNGELLVTDAGRQAVLRLPQPPLPAEGAPGLVPASPAAGLVVPAASPGVAPTSGTIPPPPER